MGKSHFYGWKLLGAFWMTYMVNLGFPAYGSSVMNAYMAIDLHMNRKMLGAAFSLFQLMIGLCGPLTAYCIRKGGVRRTAALGGFMVFVGSLAMAMFVHKGWQAILVFGVVVGFGASAWP